VCRALLQICGAILRSRRALLQICRLTLEATHRLDRDAPALAVKVLNELILRNSAMRSCIFCPIVVVYDNNLKYDNNMIII